MRRFGLVGKRLDYSFSKDFFSDFFQKNALEASYENIEVSEIEALFARTDFFEFEGLSVTIPYKTAIIPFLDELSPEAKAVGAVNCVKIDGKKTIGYNTDAFGFQQSIKPFLENRHEKALILGTGGASKAVEYVLKNIGIEVIYISRNPKKENQFSYDDINEHMLKACKMLVNTTPIGTFPAVDEMPQFPTHYLDESHFVVDLIYNPAKTRLLREAEEQGALILNGASMLREQALKAWEIWNS